MKKLVLFVFFLSTLCFISCSKNDSEYPKSVNIKYEITTTRNTTAMISRTVNNETIDETIENLPYSFTYAQESVDEGTYLKLTFLEYGDYEVGQNGSTWTDYEATLSILVDEEVVKTQTFPMIEFESKLEQIDYTFE